MKQIRQYSGLSEVSDLPFRQLSPCNHYKRARIEPKGGPRPRCSTTVTPTVHLQRAPIQHLLRGLLQREEEAITLRSIQKRSHVRTSSFQNKPPSSRDHFSLGNNIPPELGLSKRAWSMSRVGALTELHCPGVRKTGKPPPSCPVLTEPATPRLLHLPPFKSTTVLFIERKKVCSAGIAGVHSAETVPSLLHGACSPLPPTHTHHHHHYLLLQVFHLRLQGTWIQPRLKIHQDSIQCDNWVTQNQRSAIAIFKSN